MITHTMDDLAHPHILDTAKKLADHQVKLGFCRYQDQEDFAQDLLLHLSKKFQCFTGELPLVTWACKLLRNYLAAINRRFLGVRNVKPKGNRAQANVSVLSENVTPTTNPVTVASIKPEQNPPSQNQEPAVSAGPISQSNVATHTDPGQRQEKTTLTAREERAQGASALSGRAFESKQTKAGTVRKLLHGFWAKLSSWVQGPQRDQPPESSGTVAKRSSSPASGKG